MVFNLAGINVVYHKIFIAAVKSLYANDIGGNPVEEKDELLVVRSYPFVLVQKACKNAGRDFARKRNEMVLSD